MDDLTDTGLQVLCIVMLGFMVIFLLATATKSDVCARKNVAYTVTNKTADGDTETATLLYPADWCCDVHRRRDIIHAVMDRGGYVTEIVPIDPSEIDRE